MLLQHKICILVNIIFLYHIFILQNIENIFIQMDYVTDTLDNIKNGVSSMFDSKKETETETENVNNVNTNQKTEYKPRDFLLNFYKKEGGKRNKKSKQKTKRNRKNNKNSNKKSNKKSKKQQSK